MPAKKPDPKIPTVPSRPLTTSEARLADLFAGLEEKSLDTLETAARQIVTLCTTLLAAFFGLLSLKDAPAFLGYCEVKILAALALLGFLVALACALTVLLPRHYRFLTGDLTAMRSALATMLITKRRGVTAAAIVFGVSALAMFAAALDILLLHI
jgi:hypothetical protein